MKPGDRFGRLVVVGKADRWVGRVRCVALLCDCGVYVTSGPRSLETGARQSCSACVAVIAREKIARDRELDASPYRLSLPFQRAAQAAASAAIVRGDLVRPDECSKCGKARRVQAHHEDYSKPLDVVWLCASCHARRHVEISSGAAVRAASKLRRLGVPA